jgi:hypothetical protein
MTKLASSHRCRDVSTKKINKCTTALNYPTTNELIKKWETELNRNFSKEEIQVAQNMKKCSPSLAIKVMQIKRESLYTAGGNVS